MKDPPRKKLPLMSVARWRRSLLVAAACSSLSLSILDSSAGRRFFCLAFSPVPDALSPTPTSRPSSPRSLALGAVSKRQLAIFDGPELSSIVTYLWDEGEELTPDLAARASDKDRRVGGMSIVVGTAEEDDGDNEDEEEGGAWKGRRIVGVEADGGEEDGHEGEGGRVGGDEVVSLGGGIYVYADSVATVPRSVSDEDAISTAAAGLCGVHCGAPRKGGTGKAVVVGGSDYARFAARGLEAVGADVSLVSIRPGVWLPSDSKVKVMEPTVGKLKLGFSGAIGKFDTLIDTLGDEAKLGEIRGFSSSSDGAEEEGDGDRHHPLAGQWIISELSKQHDCGRYISTVTRSQKYVLDEGLLFARSPVLRYQSEIEQSIPSSTIRRIRPPLDYGPLTLQPLVDQGVIYRADRNENGPNANKRAFVRGCCFADLTEFKTWPRDSSGGTKIRYGFPVRGEVDLAAAVKGRVDSVSLRAAKAEKVDDADDDDDDANKKEDERTDGESGAIATSKENALDDRDAVNDSNEAAKGEEKKKAGSSPHVLDIRTVKELNDRIVERDLDAVLFLSASYCRTCKSLNPAYARSARIHRQAEGDDVVYARADVGGTEGKLIGRALGVEMVPAFLFFSNGERYGVPLGIKRLPSRKFDLAVEYLRRGRTWDPAVFEEEEEGGEGNAKRGKEVVGTRRLRREE